MADDPYWCSVKIDGQKRYTREVTGDNPWTDHVSLLVYNLHADKVKYISTRVPTGLHIKNNILYFPRLLILLEQNNLLTDQSQ